jgi:hypothetical protein
MLLPLEQLPTRVTITGRDQVEREAVKVVLPLQLFMQIAEQSFGEVDSCPATPTHEMMMSLSFYCFVPWLLT